ncbi:MAG: hypothetical protein R2941_05380 [Desulfobacterales bacterium]
MHAPYEHLRELERILRPGAPAILSTPYDWSEAAAPVESWIGGHSQRSVSRGDSREMLRTLLAGAEKGHSHQLKRLRIVSETNEIPWSVRIHERSAVQYLVHLLILEKSGEICV